MSVTNATTQPIRYIDSHTEGEPTRVIVEGAEEILAEAGPLPLQVERLRQADWFRRSVILEPRGWDALVGAVLCKPHDPSCAAGVIFINNAGYLGMCGHGAIGVAVTLHHMGVITLGRHWIETPVGKVEVNLLSPNRVAIENVPSYRWINAASVEVAGLGTLVGDVAWGGNWFFLVDQKVATDKIPNLTMQNLDCLTNVAGQVRAALESQGVTGAEGAEIDHIEFCGVGSPDTHGRNFVYCPGGAYDRSPCGTGTSAKVACLAADGKLRPGEVWVQESIIGSRFEASYRRGEGDRIIPSITGQAFVCAEGTLYRGVDDPLRDGISQTEPNPYKLRQHEN